MWEKERAIKFVEKNERLSKMVADLTSGFYERLFKGWNSLTKDKPFSTEEGYHFSIYCRDVVLPSLMQNFDQNRLRVAYVLSFIDSTTLSRQLKNDLKIAESVVFDKEYQTPSLFKCADKTWGWQCDNVGAIFGDIHLAVESGLPADLFEFCGCMVGKRFTMTSGYCFQTTEFPQSGAIFVEGVNYILRSNSGLNLVAQVGDGKKISEVEVIDGVADMYYMGGVWQPTRCLNQGIRC